MELNIKISENRCIHCKRHMGATSSYGHCFKCASNCSICDQKLCNHGSCHDEHISIYSRTCSSCNKNVCMEHSVRCDDCYGIVCSNCYSNHRKMCDECQTETCGGGTTCKVCGNFRCFDSGCAYGDCSNCK